MDVRHGGSPSPTSAAQVPSAPALHADAVDTLIAWQPPDEGQALLRDEYVQFLHAHHMGHLRDSDAGHLTASALVIDASTSRVLLTLHPKVSRWLQTGGHIEPDDASLLAAAAREACEESGIDGLSVDPSPLRLDRHLVPCRPGVMLHHLDVQFLAVAPHGSLEHRSSESLDLQWFDHDALPEVDDSVRALVAAARTRLHLRQNSRA